MRQSDLFLEKSRLFDALCTPERLEAGFRAVKKNQGSPGIDGVTITDFESALDEELSRLKAELASWTYQPSPVRRVEIPKPGGKGIRLLGVPMPVSYCTSVPVALGMFDKGQRAAGLS